MKDIAVEKFYLELLGEVKTKIKAAQLQAMIAVNQQLLSLYWEIGLSILVKQKEYGWGAKVVEHLAKDLRLEFPNLQGYSKRNLMYMRQFAEAYPQFEFVQAPLAQISWYHNITLLQKCSTEQERIWYASAALEYGWSRDIMVHQIESRLRERQGNAPTNFKARLPNPNSELAQQTLKDPYIFDFLTLEKEAKEKDLEMQLLKHITRFLLELGAGFAFVGAQYPLVIAEEEYRIDLLFYHLKLCCYVAIDLKVRKFKPHDAGQMNFYLSALDDLVKSKTDNPSIGIILCKDKNNVVVEYALKDVTKPIGVSAYQLTEALPDDLKSGFPSVAEFEQKLKDAEDGD